MQQGVTSGQIRPPPTFSFTAPPSPSWNRSTTIGTEIRPPPSCPVLFPNKELARMAAFPDPCTYTLKALELSKPTFSRRTSMFYSRPRATDPMNGTRAALSLSGGHTLHDHIDPGVGDYDCRVGNLDCSQATRNPQFNFLSKTARFVSSDPQSFYPADSTRMARSVRGKSRTPNMLTCGSTPGERPTLAHTLRKLPSLERSFRRGPREAEALKAMFRQVANEWDDVIFTSNEGIRYAGGLYK